MSKDGSGLTALMRAAWNGHVSCVELLIPVSDALAKNKDGETASGLARGEGHIPVAALIDAYAIALREMSEIGSLVAKTAPRKKPSLRV